MSIDAKQLRDLIIIPALLEIDKYSDAAVNLLLGTCAQESAMGKYLAQVPKPIAKGIFQMEDATHDDIYQNYLKYKQDDSTGFGELFINEKRPEAMIYDLRYAATMCRVHYVRVPKSLPGKDNILGMAEYWKRYYNTELGAGTVDEFMENYQRYVAKVAL
jgi:hypothetical protein